MAKRKAKTEKVSEEVKAPETKKPVETVVEKEVVKPTPEVKKAPVFKVAIGKSLTSLKGVRDAGTVVNPSMFPGGKETFDNLLEKGCIVKE